MKFRIHDWWGDRGLEALGAKIEEYTYKVDEGTKKKPKVVEKHDLAWFIELDMEGLRQLIEQHDVMVVHTGDFPFIQLDKRGGRFRQR